MRIVLIFWSKSEKESESHQRLNHVAICLLAYIHPYLSTFLFFLLDSCFRFVPAYLLHHTSTGCLHKSPSGLLISLKSHHSKRDPEKSTYACQIGCWRSAAVKLNYSMLLLQDMHLCWLLLQWLLAAGGRQHKSGDKKCHPALQLSAFISPWPYSKCQWPRTRIRDP